MDTDEVPTLLSLPNFVPNASSASSVKTGRVPLSIITGFLGSGKTTLLKRILTVKHGYRIAVIMNEFGDTADIESRAISVSSPDQNPGETADEFLELANGCLCCSIKDTGVAAIEKLMRRKGAFDYILLETTGLADPGPIASMFWQNEEMASGTQDIYLDGVICVVDAVFGLKQMREDQKDGDTSEFVRQIACADVVLLNKIDIATPELIQETETALTRLNLSVSVHRTVQGDLSLDNILNLDAYTTHPEVPREFLQSVHDHEHDDPETHDHFHGISPLLLPLPVLDAQRADRLDEWIRSILWEGSPPSSTLPLHTDPPQVDILRCKGIYISDNGKRFILQGVRNLYEWQEVDNSETASGKIVLIGKGLQPELLKQSLRQALA